MIQFDIVEIIHAEEEILMDSPEGAFFCTHFSDNPQEALEGMTINSVWKSCIDRIGNSSNGETMSLAAERLIIGLIHKGISKNQIRVHHTHFAVSMNNKDYLIIKRADGIVIKLIKCEEFKGIVVSTDAILFARLAKDLLGLDVLLVECQVDGSPHASTAIRFKEPLDGDSILYEGHNYYCCEPSSNVAKVGDRCWENYVVTRVDKVK